MAESLAQRPAKGILVSHHIQHLLFLLRWITVGEKWGLLTAVGVLAADAAGDAGAFAVAVLAVDDAGAGLELGAVAGHEVLAGTGGRHGEAEEEGDGGEDLGGQHVCGCW